MKSRSLSLIVLMVALVVLGGLVVFAQTIYKAEAPMPTEYLSVGISDKELVVPLRAAFPLASHEKRGLRLYLPDSFALVPVEDFKCLANWYWGNTFSQSPEDSIVGLLGLASSLPPWSKVPIGFAVRKNQVPAPYIYLVFITREAGQLVPYRLYWDDGLIYEKVSQPDCLVRLVVIF